LLFKFCTFKTVVLTHLFRLLSFSINKTIHRAQFPLHIYQCVQVNYVLFILRRGGAQWGQRVSKLLSVFAPPRCAYCISAAYVVVRCPSVCPSCSRILSKRVQVSSKHFTVGYPSQKFANTKRYGNISTETPNWGKNRDFRLRIDDCWSLECRQHLDCGVKGCL